MTKLVYCLVGLPGSGKSTFAKDLMKREPGKWLKVNKDLVREMLHNNVWSQENEELTRKVHDNTILAGLRYGKNIINDNTNLSKYSLRKLHKLLENVGDVKVIYKAFQVGVEECLRRNALREGKARVPDEVIKEMAKKAGIRNGNEIKDEEFYYPPKAQAKKYDNNNDLPKAIICDLDGSIAEISHRSPYDTAKCFADMPVSSVVDIVKMFHRDGHKIIFCSGREDTWYELTKDWLDTHVGIEYELFMRPSGNFTKDALIKETIFNEHIRDKYNVRAVIDDRLQVCQLWYQLGLPLFRVGDPDANF